MLFTNFMNDFDKASVVPAIPFVFKFHIMCFYFVLTTLFT
jgi:hypothetical protein